METQYVVQRGTDASKGCHHLAEQTKPRSIKQIEQPLVIKGNNALVSSKMSKGQEDHKTHCTAAI